MTVLAVLWLLVSKFELIEGGVFKPAPLWKLQWPAILGAMGLGFCLSLLFFMDHNIAGAIINSADNRWEQLLLLLLRLRLRLRRRHRHNNNNNNNTLTSKAP